MSPSQPDTPRALQLPPAHLRATLWAAALWTLLTALSYHWHVPALAPQLLRMGAATGERLAGEPWRLLAAPLLTDGALQLLVVVFGLLIAQPLEALWGTSAWIVILLGGSVLGHLAGAVLPSQLSVGPVAGLVALLVATARLQAQQLQTDARSARNLRRAAVFLLVLHLPLLVVWPAVSPLGVVLGLVVGWLAPAVARWPLLLRRTLALGLLAGAVGALGWAWQLDEPWQLRTAPAMIEQRAAGWLFTAPSQLGWRVPQVGQGAEPPSVQSKLYVGDPQLDVLVASAVPAAADVTATATAVTTNGRETVQTRAVLADCAGRRWLVRASVLRAAPEPWQDVGRRWVATLRPHCP